MNLLIFLFNQMIISYYPIKFELGPAAPEPHLLFLLS